VLTLDDLKLDRVERKVEREGRRIDLTSKQFALLEYLIRNAGRHHTRHDHCAPAQVDKKKVNRLATAIQVAFQQLGAYPTADLSSIVAIDETVDVRKAVPVVALPHTEENGDLIELRKELEQALAPEIARGEVEVRSGQDGLVISLREAGFFDSGSAGVKVGSQQAFSRMATLLGERQYNIRIEGHTDNVPIHNT
jgi:chemotaxis protein MotB